MAAQVVEQRFGADEAAAAASTSGLLRPLPWAEWSARVRSLDVDGVRVDYVEMDPYQLEVPPFAQRPDAPVRMMLSIILQGRSVGRVDGHSLTLSAKQAALIDGRAAMWFEAKQPVRALRMFVNEDHLPAEALRSPSLPFAMLRHTPLVTGCIGLLSGLLQTSSSTIETHDEEAVSQPLIALQASLLNQALHQDVPETNSTSRDLSRRERVAAHIDQHLGDQDLSVETIAAALHVSVRTVHATYDGSGTTAAGDIRARRVARAQALLLHRPDPPHVAGLAARVGLSRDQLTRLFQNATGQTVRLWWEHHHRP